MSAPLQAPDLPSGTGAIAGKAHVESRRRQSVGGSFTRRRCRFEAQLRGAGARSVKPDQGAATLVIFGGEEKTARRNKVKRLWRGRNRAQDKSASQRQRLLRRPQRICLRFRARDQDGAEINTELCKALSVRRAMLGKHALGRRPEDEAARRRIPCPGEGKADRGRFLTDGGGRHFHKPKIGRRANILKGARRRWKGSAGEAGDVGSGGHEKS
ncbi:MAG: hypothetical protein K2Y29_21205 [Beijerinckiaceae bacterium]|nr:hypothetical protein [Beijerinckiaceae bacterium]